MFVNRATLDAWHPRMLAILRIMTGLLFLEHGTQKLLNFPPRVNNAPMPDLTTLPGMQGVIELVGGIMIILGLLTRPVAFILAGDMAVAYFMAHAPRGFFPLLNGGALAMVYCFVFLYFSLAGAGEWSLDRMRASASERASMSPTWAEDALAEPWMVARVQSRATGESGSLPERAPAMAGEGSPRAQ